LKSTIHGTISEVAVVSRHKVTVARSTMKH
jgi:hypothetical protein